MPYFIGQNARVGVAINAETAGCTWDGTPGDYDMVKLVTGGGFKVDTVNSKVVVEELDVDGRDVVTGGIYYGITLDTVLSYSYREKLFQLIAGGAIATGGAGPYVHDFAKDDKVLFGSIMVEYTDQCAEANEVLQEIYDNFCVTGLSVKESPEGYATLSVTGIANSVTRSTTEAALTAVNHSEIVSWAHLTTSLDGTTTYRLADINFGITQPLTTDFDHGSSAEVLDFIGRSGMRSVKWGVSLRMNEAAHTLIADVAAIWDGVNSFTWNNGAAAAAEREIVITLGDSYMEGRPRVYGIWEREKADISLLAMDGTTASFDFQITNSRVTIPA